MSAALAVPIILEVARRVGAPLIESIFRRHLGKTAGELAGTIAGDVLDTIAGKAGVSPDALPELSPADLDAAVTAAEGETPELVAAWTAEHAETNRLLLAELEAANKAGAWTWGWRPAIMWMLGGLWLWSLVLVPLVNALTGAAVPLHLDELVWLTTTYLALYMGGHTLKAGIASWRGGDAP